VWEVSSGSPRHGPCDKFVSKAVLAANQGYRSDWSALFAGLVIAILPVLAVYVVFQRRIQDGLAVGAFR